jgi:hypothetical protein
MKDVSLTLNESSLQFMCSGNTYIYNLVSQKDTKPILQVKLLEES